MSKTQDRLDLERKQLCISINQNPKDRAALEEQYGTVWDSEELRARFSVSHFLAPFVTVECRKTGLQGALLFQHSPRFYFCMEGHKWVK